MQTKRIKILQPIKLLTMKTTFFSTYLFVIILLSLLSCNSKKEVDLIITNAKIYTVNKGFDIAEAMTIIDGKFAAIGSNNEILNNYKSDSMVDVQGKAIYPGFNDGHSHFLGYGLMKTKYADLVGTKSFDEIVDRVVTHNESYPASWVLGRGWDQNDWDDIAFPTKDKLDIKFPNTPVVLTRIDGHALVANSKALKLAGIDENTRINGGEVVKENGNVTGVLIDNAMGLVRELIPGYNLDEKKIAFQRAQKDCFEVGLTSVTDAGLDKDEIFLIDELQKQGLLDIRIYAMLNPTEENFNYFFSREPINNDKLSVSSVKLYIDGALGSRGALLIEPYSDAPHTHGLQLNPKSYFDSICAMAYDAGFQVNTHAIGDSGNRIMLQSYARQLKGKNDRRWRIEHAQVVNPDDRKFFKEYSIIPSVQATHCTSDMYWADERLGNERIKHAYAYNDLLEQNGWLINGTDFPIEDISPIRTYYASVVRKDLEGWPDEGFQTENALSRENALRSITIWPAMGSFDENVVGSIEPGKQADFVILNKDIILIDQSEILETEVISTFIDGEKMYDKK
jgi:predicted amidohydrolase YtcJ